MIFVLLFLGVTVSLAVMTIHENNSLFQNWLFPSLLLESCGTSTREERPQGVMESRKEGINPADTAEKRAARAHDVTISRGGYRQ